MEDNDPTPLIAQRLREERTRRKWSLDDFAEATGVSKAMLSKLERGEASPTAALLGRISGALGMTLGTLLAQTQVPATRLALRKNQNEWRDPQTAYTRRQLTPLTAPVQLVEVDLPAGAEVGFPASAYAFIDQVIWVLAGTLTFTEGAEEHTLHTGDCLQLGPPQDCVFANRGRTPCRYLVAITKKP